MTNSMLFPVSNISPYFTWLFCVTVLSTTMPLHNCANANDWLFHLESCTVHFDRQEQPMLFVLHSAITTDNEEKLVL